MSNNNSKPSSTVVKNPNNVVAAARAAEEAKGTSSVTAKAKAPEATKPTVTDAKAPSKRLSRKKWIEILAHKDRDGLTASEIAEEYSVSENNVYQWSSKLKAEEQVTETAKLSSNSLVDDAKKLIAGIDKELAEFDKGIEEAKAKVASAKDDRAKIEAKTKKYQTIIDMFTEEKKK